MATEVKVKRWGGSLAVVIPEEEVKARGIKEGEQVSIIVLKKADLRKAYGALEKELKGLDLQEVEREMDEGWDD